MKFIIAKSDLDMALDEMNKKYAFAQVNSEPCVIDSTDALNVRVLSIKTFLILTSDTKVSISGGKTENIGDLWLSSSDKTLFTGALPEDTVQTRIMCVQTVHGPRLISEVDNWIVKMSKENYFVENEHYGFRRLVKAFCDYTGNDITALTTASVTRHFAKFGFKKFNSGGYWRMIAPSSTDLELYVHDFLGTSGITDEDILGIRKRDLASEVQELSRQVAILTAQVEAQDQLITFMNEERVK